MLHYQRSWFGRLTDAAKDEIRPLLTLRHVTHVRHLYLLLLVKLKMLCIKIIHVYGFCSEKDRAAKMIKMDLRSVHDIATVHPPPPPTILSEKIKYMSKWRAVEIVMDARVSDSQCFQLYNK